MLRLTILLIFVPMILAGCAGTSKTYTEPDTGPYVQENHCVEPGNCLRDGDTPTPPGFVKNPSSLGITPPVGQGYYSIPWQTPIAPQPMPLYPQMYRYSGVQDGKYHWGRVSVDQNGHYGGWDNEQGFYYGNMEVQ